MLMSSGRVRPSIWMCSCMLAWAITSACTALVHDYKGLVLVRFFLGVAEAPYYPGALFLLSLFYTRKEIATRISILYSGNIIATAFSGLIAAAVFNTIDGNYGLEGWRWVSQDPAHLHNVGSSMLTFREALHRRGRLDLWCCNNWFFPSPGLPSDHVVAHSRGA